MKNLNYILFLSIIFTLFACEKVIEVDIENNEPKFFVEAHLFDEPGNNFVFVRKTQGVFDVTLNPALSNAIVQITEGNNTYILNHTSDGYYTNPDLIGESGKTYDLSVEIEGNLITSTSKMPSKTVYDSIYYDLPLAPNSETGDTIEICEEGIFFIFNVYTDFPNEDNYYLFDYERNGNEDTEIYVNDDLVTDGIGTEIPFYNNCFPRGDTVKTTLYSITEPMYNYYFVLSSIADNGGPFGDVTPQNPASNLNGGALGFFNTATISREETYIPN